jgi:hypothetical protein
VRGSRAGAGGAIRPLSPVSRFLELSLAREADDGPAIVDALIGLARVALRRGQLDRVYELAREGRELATARGLTESLVLPLHLDA